MLNFKEYSSEGLEDLGQVSKIIGAKGTIRFSSDRNIASTKRITVILQLENGKSTAIPCSITVSDIVRKALEDHSEAEMIGVISGLHILEALKDRNGKLYDEPRHYISPPGDGEGTPLKKSYSANDLKKVKLNWDELVKNYEKLVV